MQLKMHRSPALPIPLIPPPPGFTIRTMRPGEESAFSYCCLGEFGIEAVSPEGFANKLGDIPFSEVFYVCRDDVPVGTATAQLKEEGPFLHYIAVHPDWRGKGLGKPLISAVLQRHAALGREAQGCSLTTDDFRLAAINTYLKMGYLPVLWSGDAEERWRALMGLLGLERLEAYGGDTEERVWVGI